MAGHMNPFPLWQKWYFKIIRKGLKVFADVERMVWINTCEFCEQAAVNTAIRSRIVLFACKKRKFQWVRENRYLPIFKEFNNTAGVIEMPMCKDDSRRPAMFSKPCCSMLFDG